MSEMEIKKITKRLKIPLFKFSICTIVNEIGEYEIMKSLFEEKGFIDDCEYIIADNSKQNEFDAYQAISRFLKMAKGEYIVIVHQDVRLIDDRLHLEKCLIDLETKDNNWGVCGNAGFYGYEQASFHLSHTNLVQHGINLPQIVKSLDENFLIVNANTNITISPNLKGYHLYGTDLCIIANFLGYNCYVIEFMLLHLSGGNIAALKKYEPEFIGEYGKKMEIGFIQTTCTKFYLSNSEKKNKFLNSPFIFSIIIYFISRPVIWKRWIKRKKRRVSIIYNYLFKQSLKR